jgi:hypothetical protein
MGIAKVFTNHFELHFDETTNRLLIYAFEGGKKPDVPIAMKLDTSKDMGPEKASKWVGETMLLLIPAMRKSLFKLTDPS